MTDVRLTVSMNRTRIADGVSRMTKEALIEDKKRMDKYAEIIAHQEPVKEWMVIYALLVAVGHILEWIEKHGRS